MTEGKLNYERQRARKEFSRDYRADMAKATERRQEREMTQTMVFLGACLLRDGTAITRCEKALEIWTEAGELVDEHIPIKEHDND